MNVLRAAIIAWKYGLRQADIWSWVAMHYILSDPLHQKALYLLKDEDIVFFVKDYLEWKNTR